MSLSFPSLGSLAFDWFGQHLHLLASHCLFWEEQKMLILADVHFGKAGHFRKAGIPVPTNIHRKDLAMLEQTFTVTGAEEVLILGDLFHSKHNQEWLMLQEWLSGFEAIRYRLVEGNHDRHSRKELPNRLEACGTQLNLPPFCFTHEPLPEAQIPEGHYNLCGHIHPAVNLWGKGRQRMKLPCFFFGNKIGILPAFGAFTGLFTLSPQAQDKLFVIAGRRVMPVSA